MEQGQDTDIEMVKINSVRFNSNHSTIIANLKTSSNKVVITVPCKVDMGSSGNIIPFYMFKNSFPGATVEQLAATKDTKIKQKMYNQIMIMQLDICRVTLECKICNFFVVPGNGQALLGMPHMKLLNILMISCNAMVEREDRDMNCSTNSHSIHDAGSVQHCANTRLERSCTRTNSNVYCYTKTGSN